MAMTGVAEIRQRENSTVAPAAWLAHVAVIENLPDAEPYWRALNTDGAVSTPYQGYEYLAAWHRELGAASGISPFVVIGFDARERPQFLLPFGIQRLGPLRLVQFLGAKHANYNFALWRRDAAAAADADDVQHIVDRIAASPQRPDVLVLRNQPDSWADLANPLLLLPHRPAAENAARLVVDAPGPELIQREVGAATRGRLRTKERKLQKLPGYRYFHATEPAHIERLLHRFFELKTAHMAVQGLPNLFAEPGVQAFVRAVCRGGDGHGRPAVELHGLECDGELLALYGVLVDRESLSVMINTYTLGDNGKHSPGLILILHLIQTCADRGIRSFDLGAGGADYKSWFCKQTIALFDSFMPLTPLGRLSAVALDTAITLKREIKASPALRRAYQSLRWTIRR
jgi:CelD/BcsL family acetyltransferase involved in cellulose biosynthesis